MTPCPLPRSQSLRQQDLRHQQRRLRPLHHCGHHRAVRGAQGQRRGVAHV